MKRMKKIFAVILSLAMVMGMSLTAFADGEENEESKQTGTVTIENVVEGATLNAYQIATYNASGKYESVQIQDVDVLANVSTPTADEINNLVARIDQLGTPRTNFEYSDGNYTGNLEAGMWLILVTGSNEKIYNPMIVSVNVGTDGNLTGGEVDAEGKFMPGAVYAKSSDPELTKTTQNQTFEKDGKISFQIVSQIPEYSDSYKSVSYVIKDTLSDNLEFVDVDDIEIIVEDAQGEDHSLGLTANVNENEKTMTIDASDIALEYRGKKITVNYKAQLTENAKNALTQIATETNNKVEVEYSNDPTDSSSKTRKETETKQYTFGINATITGDEKSSNFVKVARDEYIDDEKTTKKPLPGAVFELVEKVEKDGKSSYIHVDGIGNATTDDKGLATFVGLQADKIYYLHEVTAPAGYVLRDDYVPVVVKVTFDEDGKTLKDYVIKMQGTESEDTDGKPDLTGGAVTGSYEWDAGKKISVVKAGSTSEIVQFFNDKLSSLPSTGGIGTTIFTIGGCAIMIIAAALFFASRRKEAK